jgi:hypothetical protein
MKFACILACFCCTLATTAQGEEKNRGTVSARRFALVASSNDGGAGRTPLRFANSDATSMVRVLTHLGGVQEKDLILLTDATRSTFHHALKEFARRFASEKQPRVRNELFVYFSGHSDEEGLLLANERVGYRELRNWIEEVGSDVRIGILDSCASGALLRLKGGTHRPPFLSDASTQARGHAYLTASSADEAAQESDRVGAAFFTHYLVSGLRGAADANRDQRVTLMEAYQFAYNETLHRTQASQAGAQHPNYDIQLAGSGDLVITDLHASNAHLVLPRELAGRIYIRDGMGRLIVELRKEPTYPVELGLEPGHYGLTLDKDGQLFETAFSLSSSGRVEVAPQNLHPLAPISTLRRGGDPVPGPMANPSSTAAVATPKQYRDIKFDLVLVPGFRLWGNGPEPVRHTMVLGLLGHSDSLRGLQLSLAGNIVQDEGRGLQFASALSLSYGPFVGAQIASINVALRGFYGLQLGHANIVYGPRSGAQIALINLASGPSSGAQIGLVNMEHHDLNGAQVGLFNATRGTLRGAQVGLTNLSLTNEETRGAQIGLVNLTGRGSLTALSMIGLVNIGQRAQSQIGLVNIAHEISGLQLGLVNVARRNAGASIALLPFVLDGDNRLTVSWSDLSFANIGFKLGTRYVYVVGQIGITRDENSEGHRLYSHTMGIGGHLIPRGRRITLDLDATTTTFQDFQSWEEEQRWVHSLRLQVGYWLAPHLALVVGPTIHVQRAETIHDRRPSGDRVVGRTWISGKTTVRLYPGLSAGLEF